VWRTSLYLAASASAEFFADIALCPMEAVKVRIQTQPGFAATLREGAPKILHGEGWWGYVQFVLIIYFIIFYNILAVLSPLLPSVL